MGTARRPVAASQAGLGNSAGAPPVAAARRVVAVATGWRDPAATRPPSGAASAAVPRVVSTGGTSDRRGRAARFFGDVGSITVKPVPPPGLPAAASSGSPAGSSANTRRIADANPITNR